MVLDLELSVDADTEAATFTVAVHNERTRPASLQFPTAQTVEIEIYERDAPDATRDSALPERDPVWRYGADQTFAQVVTGVVLEPGERFTRSVVWEDPPPGTYRAVATFAGDVAGRAEATFEI